MPLRLTLIAIITIGLSACGEPDPEMMAEADRKAGITRDVTRPDETPIAEKPRKAEKAKTSAKSLKGLSGTIILEKDDPMGEHAIMSVNLKSNKIAVEVDGYGPRKVGTNIVFLQTCGDNGANLQVAVADQDGFVSKASPCGGYGFSSAFRSTDISHDGKRIAVHDPDIATGKDSTGFLTLSNSGIRIYKTGGDEIGTIIGGAAPVWTPKGELLMVGTGRDKELGHGIYKADKSLKNTKRIDDGRLNNQVSSLTVHPEGTRVAFVYNGQLWEMNLKTGEPKRLLAHSHEIKYSAYSPDGKKFAFITQEPIDEGIDLGGGYRINIFDRRQVKPFYINFVPDGPLSWTE